MELLWMSSCAPVQLLTRGGAEQCPGAESFPGRLWGWDPAPGATGRAGESALLELQLPVPALCGTLLPGPATGTTCFATL